MTVRACPQCGCEAYRFIADNNPNVECFLCGTVYLFKPEVYRMMIDDGSTFEAKKYPDEKSMMRDLCAMLEVIDTADETCFRTWVYTKAYVDA